MSVATACATWYAIQGGNDLGWRVEAPARVIGAKTCIMPEVGAYYCLMVPNTDSEFHWVVTEDGADYPQHEGAAVWTRPDLARATHAKAMRELHGIRTVAEVDDNYLSDPKLNYFMRVNGFDATARLDHMKAVASMDAIIVTTPGLRAHYEQTLARRFRHCPPVYVCGNHVELDRWPAPVPAEDGRLRVGYMGSESHRWDLKLAFPALKWAADNGHHVVLIGHDPQWRRYMDYTHVPWTTPAEYRRTALPLDIGLAPLRHDTHTLGKSDIKALEYWMSGAAVIASNMPVYNQTVKHFENGILAGSREEMWIWTQRLCNDRGLREALVDAGQEYVREERDIIKHADEWREAVLG